MRRFTVSIYHHLHEGIEFSDGHVAIWGHTGTITAVSQKEISIPGHGQVMAGVLSFDNDNSLCEYEDIDDLKASACIDRGRDRKSVV